MTGPLLSRAYPRRRVERDIAEAERAALGDTATTRVLVVARPGTDSSTLVEVAFGLLGSTQPAEVVVAALEPQKDRLEMGSGLTDELAEIAATMERQQVLVKAGEDAGIPVRVMANPSSDLTGDLVVLADAVAPQYLVVWADDPTAPEVAEATDCPVVHVQPGTVIAGALAVDWQPNSDGDAAVVVACRLAGHSGAALELRSASDNRRFHGMRETLAERGVALSEAGDGALVISGTEGGGELRGRAQVDATPVDWATVELGAVSVVE
jgi:hypothetical protein